MTHHNSSRRPSPAYARRQLEAAEKTLAFWHDKQPTNRRERADKHQALQRYGALAAKWRAVLEPPPVERFRMPF